MRHSERNINHFVRLAVCILLLNAICPTPALAGGSLTDLGVLPGYSSSSVNGVSANGKAVIGVLSDNAGKEHAFRWTRTEGMTDLGALPGGKWSRAYAASPNGTVVVGEADDSVGIPHIFRWTRQTGMIDIGEGGGVDVSPNRHYAVSNDGNLVSGFINQPFLAASNAFRWTSETGMVREFSGSPANLISADGKVAVGSCRSNSVNPLCRWTESMGWVPLGTQPDFDSIDLNLYINPQFLPIDISADGKIILGLLTLIELPLGSSEPLPCSDGFKWSESDGMVTAGGIHCGFTYSLPLAVSADGSAVAGKAQEGHSISGNYIYRNNADIGTFSDEINQQMQARFFDFRAVSGDGNTILGSGGGNLFSPFYWNPAIGMRTISQWLIDNGIDVHKWLVDEGTEVDNMIAVMGLDVRFLDNFFFDPSTLSADGNVIAGNLPFNGHAFFAQAKSSSSEIGTFRKWVWNIDRNGNYTLDGCGTDGCYEFGRRGDLPVTGDWNGDGKPKIGVFRDGLWRLDYNGNGVWDGCGTTADTDRCYEYGREGDTPVVGDWNGDGKTKIGVFGHGHWRLDFNGDGKSDSCGSTADTDRCYKFGKSGDKPVVGDWNGDGKAKIGVFGREHQQAYLKPFRLKTEAGLDSEREIGAGSLIADWDEDGKFGSRDFQDGWWRLDYNGDGAWNGCGTTSDTDRCYNFGKKEDNPVVGDWSGDGRTKIGIFDDGLWHLDYTGEGTWGGCGTSDKDDRCYSFGGKWDTPVTFN